MADRKRQQAEARRKRHLARRERAREARRRTKGGTTSLDAATRWPWREAWIGEAWHDPTAILPAFAMRAHDDGRTAWVAFAVDLSDASVVRIDVGVGRDGDARAALLVLSEASTMLSTEPATIARLVDEIDDRSAGDVPGLDAALRLMGDLDPDDATLDAVFGADTPTDPGTPAPRRSWFARLFGR